MSILWLAAHLRRILTPRPICCGGPGCHTSSCPADPTIEDWTSLH